MSLSDWSSAKACSPRRRACRCCYRIARWPRPARSSRSIPIRPPTARRPALPPTCRRSPSSRSSSAMRQQVRNHLIFLFNKGAGQPAAAAYTLTLVVTAVHESAAVVQVGDDNEPTAGTVTLTAHYSLAGTSSAEVIASGKRQITSSVRRAAPGIRCLPRAPQRRGPRRPRARRAAQPRYRAAIFQIGTTRPLR